MSFLNIIGVQQRETVAGISVTDSLTTFVALRRWGSDGLHVVDVKFYTSEDGSGLGMCPYKKEFQKHMTLYDGGFNFNLALRDFCRANSVKRLGYSADDVSIGTPNFELVPIGENQLGPALALLRETSPLKDAKELTKILSHFIDAVPKSGDLSKSQDRIEPVLAVLYAICASGEVEARAQRASERAARAEAAEREALTLEARDPYFHDLRCIGRQPTKEKFELILNNGVRMLFPRGAAQVTLRNRGGRLTPGQEA
jgi:hypothetical protein